MFTPLPTNTRGSDLSKQRKLHRQKLRVRLRRLRWQVRHEINIERENALLCRLLAQRFAPDSPYRLLLRMLGRNARHRRRRLEGLFCELPGTIASHLHRRWLCRWKCWYARNAPRKWAILRLRH